MNIEIIKQSLTLAVEETFRLEPEIQRQLTEVHVVGKNQQDLDEIMCMTRTMSNSGLKTQIASALISGDRQKIGETKLIAHEQAKIASIRCAARIAIRNGSNDSRIESGNKINWNNYGYAL